MTDSLSAVRRPTALPKKDALVGLADDPEIRITAHVYERVFGVPPATLRRAPGGLTLLGGPQPPPPEDDPPPTTGAATAEPDLVPSAARDSVVPASRAEAPADLVGATAQGDPALAVALAWGTIVAAGPNPDGGVDLYSMNRHTDRCTSLDDVPEWAAPAVEALRAHADPPPPARMVVDRELPAETGLLSGAETVCAAAMALGDLHGPPAAPAPSAASPEYLAALHSRAGHALLLTPSGPEQIPFDLPAAGLRLLIIDVGGTERALPGAAVVASDPGPDVVERAAEALRAGYPAGLGPLLTEAHVPGRPTLDLALSAARDAGALGGRALGRCAVALVPQAVVSRVRAEVIARLEGETARPPRFLTAVASGRPS
ncbi:GHMP family kinase ATP-binding protein [Actinomadura harenae]|uniref:GHMP kinase N-terminal domain-containing protein n=1 Tax=Actinomadura harenae TaxID=2483351 RepID=A0A3M2L5F3_9ACTN|nr:hypothetical protein [Actinomadura harenae]RMI31095.1 hypothetical protein EBO15_42700 [Actinomadura harenae]